MYQRSDFGLSCAMFPKGNFRSIAEAAGQAGFGSVSSRPTLYQQALKEGLRVEDMKEILAENGLHISELDPYCAWVDGTVEADNLVASFFELSEDDYMEMAEALGAKSLNVLYALDKPLDFSSDADRLRQLSNRAAQYNMVVTFEFMPWMYINNLAAAIKLAEAVNHPNFGLNIDFWHHARSGGAAKDLMMLAPQHIAAVQISDVEAIPWDDVIKETARGRKMPGTGVGDVAQKLAHLWQRGINLPLTLEIFSMDVFTMPTDELTPILVKSIDKLLEDAKHSL